jgi:hypothetical protein
MEVRSVQDGIMRSENARVVESSSRTADDSGDLRAISETTSIIGNSPRGSSGGGAGSGSGGTVSSGGSGAGGGQSLTGSSRTRTDFQPENFDFSSQIGRSVSDTVGLSAGTSQGGGGAAGASADLSGNIFGGSDQARENQGSAGLVESPGQVSDVNSVERLQEGSGQEVSRDPVSQLSSGGSVSQVDQEQDLDAGSPGGIFDDGSQDQRSRSRPIQGPRNDQVPQEVQGPQLDEVQRQQPREEQVPAQELGIFQGSDTRLDEAAVQRTELREQARLRTPLRPPSSRPGVPATPNAGPFGGGIISDDSRTESPGSIDGQFSPSLEGIAFGVESDVEQGSDPTLTGLEVRGIPGRQDSQNNSDEDPSIL